MRTGQERGFYYSRVGNPTVAVVEQRLAALDGGVAAVGVSSGMTAIAYTLLALAKGSKGNIIAPSSIYGATEELLNGFLPDYGIETRFVTDRSNPEAYEELIDDETKAVYIESISNPNVEIYDIDAIAEAAHRHGVPLLVDNTIAPPPYLLRPFEHGADINVYSVTKAISGHGNVIGGFIVEKGGFSYDERKFPFLHRKQYIFRDENNQGRSPVDLFPYAPRGVAIRASFLAGLGGQLSPFDAYLIQNGLDTIAERLDKETANARKLVAYLKGSGHVGKVNYATDADSPFHDVAARLLPLGAGGLLSFEFKGDADQFAALVASLNVFSYHTNIGDVCSLITDVPDTSHVELDPKHLEKASIPRNLVRISTGLERAEDLIADLEHGFKAAFNENE